MQYLAYAGFPTHFLIILFISAHILESIWDENWSGWMYVIIDINVYICVHIFAQSFKLYVGL